MAVNIAKTQSRRLSQAVDTKGKVVRSHTVKVLVESDENLDPYDVGAALGFSAFEPHPSDPAATLRKIDVEQLAHIDPFRYIATLEYSTETPDPADAPENPLLRPVQMNDTTLQAAVAVQKDLNGDPIVNGAGDFFDPPLEARIPHSVTTFTRNEAQFNRAIRQAYVYHVNTNTFLGGEPGTVLCQGIDADRQYEGQFRFDQVKYVFEHNPLGWQPNVLNAGLRSKSIGELNPILDDKFFLPVTTPWPLYANGGKIGPGSIPDDINFKDFTLYPEADFAALGLPQ